MTPFWPTLDRTTGMPSWVRVVDRAMPPSYVTRIPTGRRTVGAGVSLNGVAAHRQGHTRSSITLALLVLVCVFVVARQNR